jgi:hypothetical protein
VRLLLIMAVGPRTRLGALEALDSARAFLRVPYRAVVVDDSGEPATWLALKRYPEADVLRNWRRSGFRYLTRSLQRAYRHALDHYDFDATLKLDTDALITGPGLDEDILMAVRCNPQTGMFGARSWRDNQQEAWRGHLEGNPEMWGPLMAEAKRHGYQPGESVLGGAYVLSHACLTAIAARDLLTLTPSGPRIAEDVTFSLFTCAVGYRLHELAGPGQPFALAWRGLPLPPSEIVAQGKKVIHSVKFSAEDLCTRAMFARIRRRVESEAGRGPADVTRRLAARTARLRAWLRWRAAAGRALRERNRRRARRILWRCLRLVPLEVQAWLALAATLCPWWLVRAGQALRATRLHRSDRAR